MPTQIETLAPGFGERLKEERMRLGLNQEEFAQLAGIKRLAQLHYEKESRQPRITYLAAVGAMGASLSYLIFGKRSAESLLGPDAIRAIEKYIFDALEAYVTAHCGGSLSSDGRYALFEIMRKQCTYAAINGQDVESSLASFFPVMGHK
jgi:transcriptional regulator with XRE-family HTH domain